MKIVLRYFDGCPNWRTADALLREALAATGHGDEPVTYEKVETAQEADRLGFVGSPTFLIAGRDPFGTAGAPTGLACRVYSTPDGMAGSPTVEQLKAVLM